MSTGQGTTWVLVADAHHARVLAVEDAGLPARLVTTLVHELGRRGARYGLASMCIGVGQGITAIFERA